MNTSFDKFQKNNISFITFNYDRSLEHYLYLSLMNSYGKPSHQVLGKVEQIPIIHVHGKVGDLVWQNERGWPYHPDLHLDRVRNVRDGMNIISEIQKDDKQFFIASDLLSNAKRVIFLGFGFHEDNLAKLDVQSLPKGKQYFGTAYDINPREQDGIKAKFGDLAIDLGPEDWKVLRYLRERVNL